MHDLRCIGINKFISDKVTPLLARLSAPQAGQGSGPPQGPGCNIDDISGN